MKNKTLHFTFLFALALMLWNLPQIANAQDIQASFSVEITGQEVVFTDTSTGDIENWYWLFGDGSYATGQNPTHTYDEAGNYTVVLFATNPDIIDFDYNLMEITVGTPACNLNADFTTEVGGLDVSFTDNSTGTSIGTWYWDFGDGNSSIQQNPTHTYASDGIYPVMLAVYDIIENCVDYHFALVSVGNNSCQALFQEYNFESSVYFENLSTGADQYFWDFGDNNYSAATNPIHSYDTPGMYDVSLTAIAADGSANIYTKAVQVGEIACDATFDVMVNPATYEVEFTSNGMGSASLINWDFGDGHFSTSMSPTHIYSNPGFYTVSLYVYDEVTGCMDFIKQPILVGNAGNDVEANFIYNANLNTREVECFDQSMGENLTYLWDYGNGFTSTEQNPVYQYSEGSFQNICLTVTNDAGISNTKCKNVQVANTNDCSASFMFAVDDENSTVFFTDNSTGSYSTWDWNFGDGATSSDANPTHTYAEAGYYIVHLRIGDGKGEYSDFIDVVNVGVEAAGLQAGFGFNQWDVFDVKDGYPADFIGASFGNAPSMQWDFGDNSALNTTTSTPTHEFAEGGIYNVCFTVSDPLTDHEATYCREIEITTSSVDETEIPQIFLTVAPNPVANFAEINYSLTEAQHVTLAIFDSKGVLLKTIETGHQTVGAHRITFDTSELANGVYYIRLQNNDETFTTPIVVSH